MVAIFEQAHGQGIGYNFNISLLVLLKFAGSIYCKIRRKRLL